MRGAATAASRGMWKSCQLVKTWKIEVAMPAPQGTDHDRHAVMQGQDGWCHGGKRAFVRRYGVGIAANDAENVRAAGLGRKIVHCVVEQESGAAHDLTAPEPVNIDQVRG